jgi:Fanconi anemia group M protein
MDYREKNSGVGEILARQHKIAVASSSLAAGDYVINDEIAVERKTALDFVQSIIDGRLFKQAAQMSRFFESSLMIIEGKDIYSTTVDIHPHAVKGALISIAMTWRIPILFTDDGEDTALLLRLLADQNAAMSCELSCRPGRRPKRMRKRQLYILQGLPHVGPRLAIQLLDHFGSVEKVMTAPEEELRQIPKLGRIKAQKIRDAVSKSF